MRFRFWSACFACVLLAGFFTYYYYASNEQPRYAKPAVNLEDFSELKSAFKGEEDDPGERAEFDFNRLRDPITGSIAFNMRARELNFAKQLSGKTKSAHLQAATWDARGPANVGGRTRALAIDLDFNGGSNRRILAGGVSGGIYISENDGGSWQLTTGLAQFASVTCLVQDPNNHSIWYHGTGELFNSIRGANYLGQGIFKSTNSGETWQQLASTVDGSSQHRFDNPFDFVWNMAISPQTGTIFAATIATVGRSVDGGNSWQTILAGQDAQGSLSLSTDVVVAADGAVYATLSKNGIGLNAGQFGVFRSTNDGQSFTNISPQGLSADPYRMVLGAAPSDAATVYLLVQANAGGMAAADHQLFRYNASSNTWTNLTANLPNPQGPVGTFNSQGGYDLLVKVKPDNANTFWIGGTNLHRSTNGGQSYDLVGGYIEPQTIGLYENHHPDQHAFAFYPNNANAAISGHDGGLSRTTNVLQQPQKWESLNNGYTTTQFYAVAIDPQPGNDAVIIGGAQDNGTWVTESTNGQDPWFSLLSGDGSYTAIAPGGFPFYVSSQNGFIVRGALQNNQIFYSVIGPAGAQDFLFIAPYLLDPNDPRVMYLAAGNTVWRNSNLDAIPLENPDVITVNWQALSSSAQANTSVTALAVTTTPANRLYFGASGNDRTVLRRVDTAQNNPSGSTITPPGIVAGSYTACIATNPADGDEILVAYSNFNVPSLWHSTDGGFSWNDVEGNLTGEDGPSIRWAVINPNGGYFLATSVGVFSTSSLNGNNTNWTLEGGDVIGNVVVDMLALRPEDGFIAAGTHGRGIYSAKLTSGGTAIATTDKANLQIHADPGQTGNTSFTLRNEGQASLNFSVTATADFPGAEAQKSGRNIATLRPTGPIPGSPWFRSTQAQAGTNTSAQVLGLDPQKNDGGNTAPKISQDDVLILDDGDDTADDYIGFNDGVTDFYWMNVIDLPFDYRLRGFYFYMRTENAISNPAYVAVRNGNGGTLVEGNIEFTTAPNGDWFQVNLNTPITFDSGDVFQVLVGASRTIGYPAGTDVDAAIPGYSFYFSPNDNDFLPLSGIQGFENGAFIMRPFGDILQSENQPPVAVAQVSHQTAQTGEHITFDASGSSDNDGQITGVLWDFGDGDLSTNIVATHAYLSPGTFNFSLTVTDDFGATGQVSGQVEITAGVTRLTVQPASGSISPGNSQNVNVSFNAENLTSGAFNGEVRITGNGGTLVLPLSLTVGMASSVEAPSQVPEQFALAQNYPNPFNPGTVISYSLPHSSHVRVVIYNTRGQQIRVLSNVQQEAGVHQVSWDGTDTTGRQVASGVYIYRIEAGDFVAGKKMTLLH